MTKEKEKKLKEIKQNYKSFNLSELKSSRREVGQMSKGSSPLAKESKRFMKSINAEISVRIHERFENGKKKMRDLSRQERRLRLREYEE